MAASRLTLLLLFMSASLWFAQSLPVCSAPACLVVDGTPCERTLEACPRCLAYDPLLDTITCTNVPASGKCPSDYTFCPATALATGGSSDNGSPSLPLNTTTRTSTPSPQPSLRAPSVISPLTESAGVLNARENHSGIVTWTLVIAVAAVCVFAVAASVVLYKEKQKHAQSEEPMTPPLPPMTRNTSTRNDRFVPLQDDQDDAPPTADSFRICTGDLKPSNVHTLQMSGLAFTQRTESQRRQSSVPELLADSERSVSHHSVEDESLKLLGVDNIPAKHAAMPSRVSRMTIDDVDVFLTTVQRERERGSISSPTTKPRYSTPCTVEASNERASYARTSLSQERMRTPSPAEWKAKYGKRSSPVFTSPR